MKKRFVISLFVFESDSKNKLCFANSPTVQCLREPEKPVNQYRMEDPVVMSSFLTVKHLVPLNKMKLSMIDRQGNQN